MLQWQGLGDLLPRRWSDEDEMANDLRIALGQFDGHRCHSTLRYQDACLCWRGGCAGKDLVTYQCLDRLDIGQRGRLIGSSGHLSAWIPHVVAILQAASKQVGCIQSVGSVPVIDELFVVPRRQTDADGMQ